MNSLQSRLATTPLRFHVLAVLAATAILLLGQGILWDPWRQENTVLGEGWGQGVGRLCTIVWAATPLAALLWPLRAAAAAVLPFGIFTVLTGTLEWSFAMFVALVSVAMVSLWRSRWKAGAIAVLALVPIFTYVVGWTVLVLPYNTYLDAQYYAGDVGYQATTFGLYAAAAALALGVAWWMRRSALAAARAAELEARSREVERVAASTGERARLARDLHDVVAHHVSLIAVRAETAPYTVPDLSDDARGLLAEIAADSRRALDELRGVLGILRRSEESTALAPQPSAADIARLVEQARDAGETIDWEEADLHGVTAQAGYVAYRLMQEGLTNARRHAPGALVRLETQPLVGGGLRLSVSNLAVAMPAEGGGLTGMRERVEGLGGRLTIEHISGELVVAAEIPGVPR